MYQETMTQGLALVDVLNSQSVNNTSVNSIGIDMSKYKRALFIIGNGGLGAAGTLDGRLQSSSTANFAAAHNIANTNLTQIVGNNLIATIEVRADQVQQSTNGDRYVRLNLTGAGNALTVFAFGFGGEAVQKPGNAGNLNSTWIGQQIVCSI